MNERLNLEKVLKAAMEETGCSRENALQHYQAVVYENMLEDHHFRDKITDDLDVLEAIAKVFSKQG